MVNLADCIVYSIKNRIENHFKLKKLFAKLSLKGSSKESNDSFKRSRFPPFSMVKTVEPSNTPKVLPTYLNGDNFIAFDSN